jgi:hypothetical protein
VPSAASPAHRTGEIQVAFAGSAPQRRLTVLFRAILAIPHLIVLYFLSIAAEVVAIICWFAALFTGRLPAALAGFLAGWLRWTTRVYGYYFLLADQYPPFDLGDTGYPVRVAVAPGPLNRLAVFFRFILCIPAALLAGLAGVGLYLASVVIWVLVLITGRMPDALHQAVAATLRYQARLSGYTYLLTGTYPGGLFGDRPEAGAPAAAPGTPAGGPGAAGQDAAAPADAGGVTDSGGATEAGATAQPPAGATWVPGAAPSPGPGEPGQPGYAQPPPDGVTPGLPAPDPQAWRLVLSSGARKLVGLFVALGAIGLVAYIVVIIVAGTSGNTAAQRANAITQVSHSHSVLVGAMGALQQQAAACQTNATCVTKEDSRAANAFLAFNSALRVTPMPDGAASAASLSLQRDIARAAADFRSLSTATSGSQYQQMLASSGLQQTLTKFNADYQRLGVALGAVKG